MGLVTLPILGIQYFSFSEEIIALTTNFFTAIFTFSPYWFVIIFAFTIVFIIAGVFYRVATEIEGVM